MQPSKKLWPLLTINVQLKRRRMWIPSPMLLPCRFLQHQLSMLYGTRLTFKPMMLYIFSKLNFENLPNSFCLGRTFSKDICCDLLLTPWRGISNQTYMFPPNILLQSSYVTSMVTKAWWRCFGTRPCA